MRAASHPFGIDSALDSYARGAQARRAEARSYWRVGMAAGLPLVARIEGEEGARPVRRAAGVIERIEGDHADVRIYASPEHGATNCEVHPFHGRLAVGVLLVSPGRHGLAVLQRLADAGRLTTGDAALGARTRAHWAGQQQRSARRRQAAAAGAPRVRRAA